jgi:AraC-like DNA-binding protein
MLTYRSLYVSPLLSVSDYHCCAGRHGPWAEEYSNTNNIVLMRHGAFGKHFGRRSITADVNQAVFFSKDSSYRISHPGDCGDRGTIFALSPRVLNDIVREIDASIDDHPDRPFPFVAGPCDAGAFWRHHSLVQRLEARIEETPDPLWADVTALQLVADLLDAAFAWTGRPRRPRRTTTDAAQEEQVEAVKGYLASRLGERLTLDQVARAAHASPFHLARVFRQRTGTPIHRYLTRLRLRASLERLAAGACDLTAVALELGFSSHSHYTDAFRREFGYTPSRIRGARWQIIAQMSKNLEV